MGYWSEVERPFRILNRKIWARKIKSRLGCRDCGNKDYRVLDFDHVRGKKEGNVGRMIKEGASFFKIREEVRKCEVRCANCHRIKTREREAVGEIVKSET
jgi:hypothetical protein